VRWAEDSRHLAMVNNNGTVYILRVFPFGRPKKGYGRKDKPSSS